MDQHWCPVILQLLGYGDRTSVGGLSWVLIQQRAHASLVKFSPSGYLHPTEIILRLSEAMAMMASCKHVNRVPSTTKLVAASRQPRNWRLRHATKGLARHVG